MGKVMQLLLRTLAAIVILIGLLRPIHGNDEAAADASLKADSTNAPAEPTPQAVDVGATKPAHRFGPYYLTGQPAPTDLDQWKRLGIGTVINLRMPNEIDWDEQAAVEALGMKYVSIPFAGPDTLTENKLKAVLRLLRPVRDRDQARPGGTAAEKPEPILLHCASSNRVGAIWYAHRILHDGLHPNAALKEAKTVGLRTMGYLVPVDRYIERQTTTRK
jgi:protein tyrosine phosphatase (PTP) superfamily phosphohydrolase (DUF442 family)